MFTTSPALCDLHTHSHFSDGSLSPRELICMAEQLELGALALTDHNTIDGLEEFQDAARGSRIIAVPGVELSTEYTTSAGREVELHILALFLPRTAFSAMANFTGAYAIRKAESTQQMVDALHDDGYRIDYETLQKSTPNGNLNRAHVATVLCREGYVKDIKEAFNTLLSVRGGYYVPPHRSTATETIAFVRSLGALPVLAHPLLTMTPEETEEFLPEAKAQGLVGMETRYVTYDEPTTAAAIAIAARHGILESGGSDFHGVIKPGIAMATGRGNLQVPMDIYERLAARADS